MDKEYVESIVESYHIDEGVASQLKARAMSATQRFGAATGGDITSLQHTRIKSSFNSLLSNLQNILQSFVTKDANRLLQAIPRPTSRQTKMIEVLKSLYAMLTPSVMQKHQTAQNILKEIIQEDTRLAALQSNNVQRILDYYTQSIRNAYDSFMGDVKRFMPRVQPSELKKIIKKMLGQFNPQWPAKMDKIDKTVTSITPKIAVPPVIQSPASTVTQPAIPTPAPAPATAASPTSAVPPVIPTPTPISAIVPSVVPTVHPVIAHPSAEKAGSAITPVVPSGTVDSTSTDFAKVVNRVIDIIIDAVKSDATHARKYLSPHQEPYPKAWLKEATRRRRDYGDEGGEDELDREPPHTIEGEFIYNFHSHYRKARNFSIEVKPLHVSNILQLNEYGETNLIKIEVLWNNQSTLNKIIILHQEVSQEPGGSVKPVGEEDDSLIFKFYDHNVMPEMGSQANFSVYNIIRNANPPLAERLKTADPTIVAEINSKSDNLFRAFWAVTLRKSKEFRKKVKGLDISVDSTGNVWVYINGKEKPAIQIPINSSSHKDIKTFLRVGSSSPVAATASEWEAALTEAGFFKLPQYAALKPELPLQAKQAIEILVRQNRYPRSDAEYLINQTLNKISTLHQTVPIQATDLVKLALTSDEPIPGKISPNIMNDAILSLTAIGFTELQATTKVSQALDYLTSSGVDISAITDAGEITRAALKSGKPTSTINKPEPEVSNSLPKIGTKATHSGHSFEVIEINAEGKIVVQTDEDEKFIIEPDTWEEAVKNGDIKLKF